MALFGILGWFKSSPAVTAVEQKSEAVAEAAPAKAASVAHAVLETLEEHEKGHPLIQRFLLWLDECLSKYGQPLMVKIEIKVLMVLAFRYPLLSPAIAIVIADLAKQEQQTPQQEPPKESS